VRLNLHKFVDTIKALKEYLFPVRKVTDRFQSLTSLVQLKKFIQERSAHVSQTTLFGYIKTRMGFKHYLMFEDKPFLESLDIAKWNVYVSCLLDCTFYAFSYLYEKKNFDCTKDAEKIFVEILLEEESNGLSRKISDAIRNEFKIKLRSINWSSYYLNEPFKNSGLSLYKWSPIADELKELDKEIVLNSIKLKWNLVQNEFDSLTKDFKNF
tara:strand:+ start:113 stop:745 length:633 start_codon:yes stop_codon:yes gene_type:complete